MNRLQGQEYRMEELHFISIYSKLRVRTGGFNEGTGL